MRVSAYNFNKTYNWHWHTFKHFLKTLEFFAMRYASFWLSIEMGRWGTVFKNAYILSTLISLSISCYESHTHIQHIDTLIHRPNEWNAFVIYIYFSKIVIKRFGIYIYFYLLWELFIYFPIYAQMHKKCWLYKINPI